MIVLCNQTASNFRVGTGSRPSPQQPAWGKAHTKVLTTHLLNDRLLFQGSQASTVALSQITDYGMHPKSRPSAGCTALEPGISERPPLSGEWLWGDSWIP